MKANIMRQIYTCIVLIISFIFCEDSFSLKNSTLESDVYQFNLGNYDILEKDDYNTVDVESKATTQLAGFPELPTYSFNYSIKQDKEYEVQYVINEFQIIENINLYPKQPVLTTGQEKIFIKNEDVYNSENVYPESNLSSTRMSLRGYELMSIELIPFEYDFSTNQLKIYTNVDIVINEVSTRSIESLAPRSKVFESIYKNTVINPETYQDTRSFQKPSILYICGGSIESTSYFNSLVEWRKKQGYVVYSASLSDTGTSTTSIKNYLQDAYNNWDNPPEYICFIGDANGSVYVPTYTVYGGNGWSSASGEGDYPYSLLEGNDLLPELLLGRISVRSTSEFVTILNKIIGYEKNYSNDTSWLNTISLVGDPYDSGISTVITNEYIEQLVELHGGIDNVYTKYSGNNFDEWMRDAINGGTAYLNYRGFYGFSGFTSNDVNQLNNGYRLPFIATLTCGTGSFATETTSMTESLFRAGTSVSPKGAVAIVGTAQSYTHTAFNNIIDMGIFDGIFLHNSRTIGEAVSYGYLAMNAVYPQNPGDNVYLFNTWNSLLGDPLTHLWTSQPKELVLQHDMMVVNGSTSFQVNVTDIHSDPVSGVRVTLLNSDYDLNGLFISEETDQNGIVNFTLSDYSDETVMVTAIAQNYIPSESEFFISNDLPELNLIENSIYLDDDGNNDGSLNPGETANLSFSIFNNSSQALDDLSVELLTVSDAILIDGPILEISTLLAAEQIEINGFNIVAPNNIDDSYNPELYVRVISSSDDLLWNYNLPIEFKSGSIMTEYIVSSDDNNNGVLDRGESAEVYLDITNDGSIILEDLVVEINYVGNELFFNDTQYDFNNINIGQTMSSLNPLTVTVDENIINGSFVSIPMTITTSNGFTINDIFTIQLGQVSIGDPLGPDLYGYYIYDMNDQDYELAPDYDWEEIDPDYGGDGSEVDINDNGDNGDDVTTINLPFIFTFYGQDYDQVSICSNGWISFGETDMESFRNYTLPGTGGPSPMIAVFWDDLKTTNGGEVYQYYDVEQDAFIIEWSNVRTFFSNSVETFQIILYNTGSQTPTGDDEFKIQFKEFNNTSVGDYPVGNYDGAVIHGQYCTVGIENHLMSDGLQYTFNNAYPTAAMPLSDETAIFVTTRGSALFAQPEPTFSTNEFLFNIPMNSLDTDELVISNTGEPGSILVYNVAVSPFPSEIDQIDGFGYAWQSSFNNALADFEWIDISENNEVVSFPSNDEGTVVPLDFDFKFYDNTYSQCIINPNGWIGFEDDNNGWNNQSILDEESPRSAIFAFWDDLNPENSNNEVGSGEVKYHASEERIVIWYDQVVHWTSLDRVYDFQIVLYPSGLIDINYREMLGDTDSATIGIVDADGNYSLEVVYNSNFVEDQLTLKFNTVPSWISLDLLTGNSTQIAYNSSAIYNINISSNELSNGNYVGYIVVSTNASINSNVIPVNLYVSESSMLGDINQDEIIDVLDTVRMVSIIMGDYIPNTLETLLADINEDGQINVQDVVLIVSIILSN